MLPVSSGAGTLGVTGHRDLRPEDLGALEGAVSDLIAQVNPSPSWSLLSSLAEGADRLVARVALDHGARLMVVLPMDSQVYESDFPTPASIAEFRALLVRAEAVETLPWSMVEPRSLAYARAGSVVAARSDVLAALWDGIASGKAGGTSELVRWCLGAASEGMPPQRPACRVAHLRTPRQSCPDVAHPFSIDWLA
ncbi:hypothetical protein MCP1_30067 [Candidatus Terasakiella magnetica]|nr:hypothetical protein MCP1_30067 [Candidatus Terasakiella magnetica]